MAWMWLNNGKFDWHYDTVSKACANWSNPRVTAMISNASPKGPVRRKFLFQLGSSKRYTIKGEDVLLGKLGQSPAAGTLAAQQASHRASTAFAKAMQTLAVPKLLAQPRGATFTKATSMAPAEPTTRLVDYSYSTGLFLGEGASAETARLESRCLDGKPFEILTNEFNREQWARLFNVSNPNAWAYKNLSVGPVGGGKFEIRWMGMSMGVLSALAPAKPPAPHASGCPKCGSAGTFIRMALCCAEHGAFGGM